VSTPTIPTEQPPSSESERASGSQAGESPGQPEPLTRPSLSGLLRADALWWPTLLTAGFACFVTFLAKGGLNLESLTTTEIVLTLAGGVAAACGVLFTPAWRSLVEGPKYGLWPVALLVGFTALSGLSVVWSVQPDASFQEAGRLLAYSAVFGGAVALVRLTPERWPAILGGLVLAAVVVCGYALVTKIFPGIAPLVTYARLEEPYGYWNAIGLTAAMGAICCMWLGARRSGHALVSAMAYPAMGVLLVTLMIAYSRGALVALAIGLTLWFCIVPLRLRGAAVLIVGALGGGVVVAWDFSKHILVTDNVPLSERATAGHQLGVLLVAMVLTLTFVGIAIGFFTSRRPPSLIVRRRAGAILLAAIALAAVAFAGALAHSQRGFTGSISHAVSDLTNPNAKPPPNTPGRLTAVASVRARYWKQALQIFDAHPAVGAGAGGYETASLRYRTAPLEVKHAHGFAVQTLADLGAVGLALALALLLAWMAAAGRATHPFNRRWSSWRAWLDIRAGARPGWHRLSVDLAVYTPERIGLLSMVCVVVVFGVHSFVDWTWYVPGNACIALLCAGWLAGRGPLSLAPGGRQARTPDEPSSNEPSSNEPSLGEPKQGKSTSDQPTFAGLSPMRIGVAVGVTVAALLAIWTQWQPQRSVDASQQALALLANDPKGALAQAQSAVARDPLSAQALFTLATVQQATGKSTQAKATLQKAVRKQPSNPQTWLTLSRYDLTRIPKAAVKELQAAIYLNPESISPEAIADGNPEAIAVENEYIEALRAVQASTGTHPALTHPALTHPTVTHPARARAKARASVAGADGRPSTSASVRRRRAEHALRRVARRRRLQSPLGIRSPREAG
jgi:hypothetical protein